MIMLRSHIVQSQQFTIDREMQCELQQNALECRHGPAQLLRPLPCDSAVVDGDLRKDLSHERVLNVRHPRTIQDIAPTLILVEYRDEVFARVAADISSLHFRIVRAGSTEAALSLVNRCNSALVVANRDLPDENGWVLADKLRQATAHVETWLYMPEASMYATVVAGREIAGLRRQCLLPVGRHCTSLEESHHR